MMMPKNITWRHVIAGIMSFVLLVQLASLIAVMIVDRRLDALVSLPLSSNAGALSILGIVLLRLTLSLVALVTVVFAIYTSQKAYGRYWELARNTWTALSLTIFYIMLYANDRLLDKPVVSDLIFIAISASCAAWNAYTYARKSRHLHRLQDTQARLKAERLRVEIGGTDVPTTHRIAPIQPGVRDTLDQKLLEVHAEIECVTMAEQATARKHF